MPDLILSYLMQRCVQPLRVLRRNLLWLQLELTCFFDLPGLLANVLQCVRRTLIQRLDGAHTTNIQVVLVAKFVVVVRVESTGCNEIRVPLVLERHQPLRKLVTPASFLIGSGKWFDTGKNVATYVSFSYALYKQASRRNSRDIYFSRSELASSRGFSKLV